MKSKYRNFLADVSNQEKAIASPQPIISQHPEPEKIKHILIGSKEAVIATIEVLHQLGGGRYTRLDSAVTNFQSRRSNKRLDTFNKSPTVITTNTVIYPLILGYFFPTIRKKIIYF